MRKVGWFDIYVEDIERAQAFYETVLNTMSAAGGSIVRPKFSIGEHGSVSIVTDPEGNVIGLHSVTA